MIHRHVDEFDIHKLEQARDLVEQVSNYYFGSVNSKDLVGRLDTVRNKLTDIIVEAKAYNERVGKWEAMNE